MADHPYAKLPDHCFWRRAVSRVPMDEIDLIVDTKFQVSPGDRVVTAGSCFAQHIARYLSQSGFHYYVTEKLHSLIPDHLAAAYNYGIFSARYGNIYTARQFVQLLKRAYNDFTPIDDIWRDETGRCFDPYRPQIQPNGFRSEREYRLDREQHFSAVRRAVEECDIFVFTLGLTETWTNTEDNAVYPLCPGTAAGVFEPEHHRFINFRASDVSADMREAFDIIRAHNPHVRFIVTVSPVALLATAENRHVLVSTTYSKAVLRAVCGELEEQYHDVAYFPSFEIITGGFSRSIYLAPDLREVTEAGVRRVMEMFMRHYAAGAKTALGTSGAGHAKEQSSSGIEAAIKIVCDEEVLDPSRVA